MTTFVFDVDGTLTPSRQRINPTFKDIFAKFVETNTVNLATGSQYTKTIEQLGKDIFNSIPCSYNCAGNQIANYGSIVYEAPLVVDRDLINSLYALVYSSTYTEKYSLFVETRPGSINFSTLGRDADHAARERYKAWDAQHGERIALRDALSTHFPAYDFSIGGDISLDICPRGQDKSQIRALIDDDIVFFGDRTTAGGNDYALVKVLRDSDVLHSVASWEDTMRILQTRYGA